MATANNNNNNNNNDIYNISSNSSTKRKHHKDKFKKAKIDNTQQNSKCRFCGEKDETVNHRISRHNKQAQKKYKTRYDWEGKVIHWELGKRLKIYHTTIWYILKPEPVQENETHKVL